MGFIATARCNGAMAFAEWPRRINDVISTFGRMDGSPEGKKVLEAFRVDGWGVAVDGDFAPVLDLLRLKEVKKEPAPEPVKEPVKKGKKK